MRANLLSLFIFIPLYHQLDAQDLRIPLSATPFLTFAPDARGAAMGDAGVALSADANATYWNSAKLAVAPKDFGASVSYTPWLTSLKDAGMWLGYASAYKKLGGGQAVAASVQTFQYKTGYGNSLLNSSDIAISGMYARQLGKNLSLGFTVKYISSDIGNVVIFGSALKPGRAIAADLSAYYRNRKLNLETGEDVSWSFGAVLANIGNKISYAPGNEMFLPATIKIGGGYSYTANGRHRFNIITDLSKLMVPTPIPNQDVNSKPLVKGMLGSFTDAPDGFKEEVQEIAWMVGAEYWYQNRVALRAGYHGENEKKGSQKFYTAGIGARFFRNYGLDFSYLFPMHENRPLKSTFRISVSAYLSGKGNTDTI